MSEAAIVEAMNRYHAHMTGWRDGARALPKRTTFAGHKLEAIYAQGYDEACRDRAEASRRATKLYGYEPSILRDTDPVPDSARRGAGKDGER